MKEFNRLFEIRMDYIEGLGLFKAVNFTMCFKYNCKYISYAYITNKGEFNVIYFLEDQNVYGYGTQPGHTRFTNKNKQPIFNYIKEKDVEADQYFRSLQERQDICETIGNNFKEKQIKKEKERMSL